MTDKNSSTDILVRAIKSKKISPTREEALENGDLYFHGNPCGRDPKGHKGIRYAKSQDCVGCQAFHSSRNKKRILILEDRGDVVPKEGELLVENSNDGDWKERFIKDERSCLVLRLHLVSRALLLKEIDKAKDLGKEERV